jgi:hypothetical protein
LLKTKTLLPETGENLPETVEVRLELTPLGQFQLQVN